jgi:hypothetical protein
MRNLKLKTLAILCLTAFSMASIAEAKEKKKKPIESTISESEEPAVSAEAHSSSNTRFAAGYSSLFDFTGSLSSVAGALQIGENQLLQVNFAIPYTSPLQFVVGPQYKYTIAKNRLGGFHVGLGAAFGSLPKGGSAYGSGTGFAMSINGLAGIHLAFESAPQIQLHFDGGPVYQLTDGESNFAVKALSPFMGLSVLYFF